MLRIHTLAALTLVATTACATTPPSLQGDRYVAMGSSFAAGPGIPSYYEDPPTPCARSNNNYAHQLASRLNLNLTDVSCSGATTAHLTGPRGAIPPQLDALTSDTRLVTLTIGGNDLDQHTRRGRGDFKHHFVSFDVDQYFVNSNRVADFFLPLQQSGFSH
jgi:lysophospholipase L1-like esterase